MLVGPRRFLETAADDVLCPAIVQVSGRGALTLRPPVLALSRALVLPCSGRVYVDCDFFFLDQILNSQRYLVYFLSREEMRFNTVGCIIFNDKIIIIIIISITASLCAKSPNQTTK